MLKLLVASLFTLACSTPKPSQPTTPTPTPAPMPVADAPQQQPPHHAMCSATELSTEIVWQVDYVITAYQPADNTTFAIDRNGSWRRTTTREGKSTIQAQGCMAPADFGALKSTLATATWQTSQAEVRCMAKAMGSTTYSHNGKAMLTTAMCDGQIIDAATRKALADVNAILAKAIPKG